MKTIVVCRREVMSFFFMHIVRKTKFLHCHRELRWLHNSFLTARNLVTRKWLMARALKPPTRGSPTRKVNKHVFPTLQTLFSSKLCGRIMFTKCLPIRKKAENSLESNRRSNLIYINFRSIYLDNNNTLCRRI